MTGLLAVARRRRGGVDVSELTATRQVAQNTRWARLDFTVSAETTYAADYLIPEDSTQLQLSYSATSATDGTTYATFGAAVEYQGVKHRATFGGAYRATVTNSATPTDSARWALSDPIPVTIPKGATIRVYTVVAAGSKIMRGGAAQNGYRTATPGDLTIPGSATIPASPYDNEGIVGPVGIRAKTRPALVAVAGLGDSITEGGADANYGKGGGGYYARALRLAGLPGINFGVWADGFSAAPSGDKRYGDNLAQCSHWYSAYGTNQLHDIYLKRYAIQYWLGIEAMTGVKGAQTTITPKTNSTDGWTTVEGQSIPTPSAETARLGFNAWLLDGAPFVSGSPPVPQSAGTTDPAAIRIGDPGHPLDAIVDTNATVAALKSNGDEVFAVDPGSVPLTVDMAHPSPAGHARMAVAVAAWMDALTV